MLHALSTDIHGAAYVQATDPATTNLSALRAGILWIDTSTAANTLKKRNTGNTGWDVISTPPPVATASVLGGVKQGPNVTIAGDGTLSAAALQTVAATVTANAAAVANQHLPVDATSGPLTITLPTGQAAGTQLSVEKRDSSANTVTLSGNIRGSAGATLALVWQYESVLLRADGSGSWVPFAGHKTKAALDTAYVGAADSRLSDARTPLAHAASHASGGSDALTGYAAVQQIAPGLKLYNPRGLRRFRAARADALYARVPIVCIGDSITFGQGSDGVNSANNVPDNTQGWVGQLRQLLAKDPRTGATDPGEGFLFYTDSRVTTTGAATGANAYSGPLRHSIRLLNTQTLSFTVPAGVSTLSVIQANNSTDVTATYTKNAGGSTGLTALTGTGVSIVTDIAVVAGDAIVVSGPATAQTYITGLALKNSTTGLPVHRVGIAGYVSGDLLGGQTSGALNLTSGQQTSAIKKLYDWSAGPGLLIISVGVNDQQFQAGGGTTAQNGSTLTLYTANLTAVVTQAVADGWCVLLLGEPPNPGAANVAGGQEADYHAALKTLAQSTDHVAYMDLIDVWATSTLAQAAGLQITSSVHPTRKGHGDIAQIVYGALTPPYGENAPTT